ncbi:MAG TPA: hypothetical protein VF334_15710 [Polyangia bacterium]
MRRLALCALAFAVAGCGLDDKFKGADGLDLSVPDDGGSAIDLDTPAYDLSGPCVASTTSCADASTLSTCNADGMGATTTFCAAGCAASPTAHCKVLVPTLSVAPSDFTVAGINAVTFPAGETRLNSDTGAIAGLVTRTANTVNGNVEVNGGIAFHQKTVNGVTVGVFSFADVTVSNGATLKIFGSSAVALVSQKNFIMSGVIEARPMDGSGTICGSGALVAGPGGFAGGAAGNGGPTSMNGKPGGGMGGGGYGIVSLMVQPSGGGGAGHFTGGGPGSCGCYQGMNQPNGTGGVAYNVAPQGGSGGGGGGAAAGGGGGGSVQIDALGVITIGDGTSAQGINAGACGGQGANGAGGGGAGGRILVEAPIVQIGSQGVLAANGGGGGGFSGTTNSDGSAGGLNNLPSYGANASKFITAAGNGGAGDAAAGTPSLQCTSGCTNQGLGGGGSAGFITINAVAAPSLNAQAVLSPSLASGAASTGTATAN